MTALSRRRRMVAACAVAGLLVTAAGCGPPVREPAEVVALYFRCTGRDPVRSLELLSDVFHHTHGLAPWSRPASAVRRELAQPAPGGEASAADDPERFLDTARLGWLRAQRWIFAARAEGIAPPFEPEPEGVRVDGDRAQVRYRIPAARGAEIRQRFELSRPAPGAPWRIDRIEQEGVEAGFRNLMVAFMAFPTQETFQRLDRAYRGRRR